jgi:type IV secretory pathway VirB10-like protein
MSTTPQATPEPNDLSTAASPVDDKRKAATGVIPKQMRSWIFLTIIFVAAVGLWFSSGPTKAVKPNHSAAPSATEPVKQVVAGLSPEEVRVRIKETENASRTAATGTPVNSTPTTDAQFKAVFGDPGKAPKDAKDPFGSTGNDPIAKDPIVEDERKREYAGRFASNVALSYRSDPRTGVASPQSSVAVMSTANASDLAVTPASGLPADFQQQLNLLQAQQEKLLAQEQQQLSKLTGAPAGAEPQGQAPAPPAPARRNANLNQAAGKKHVIFEGTVLESVLVNRLNGDFAGPVICQIATDVYSRDHNELLIPAGTRVLGETKKINDIGQERLAVVFHRLIMPDGYAVDLDQAPGLNQIGETALHDKVNNHYFRIFGASIAIGAIAGLSTIGTNNSSVTGLPTSNASAYREGVAQNLSQSSLRILDRFLNILPTVTIREGHRVRIFLTEDLLLPAYSNHRMPSDL